MSENLYRTILLQIREYIKVFYQWGISKYIQRNWY